jgi:hypothetical protein
LWQALKTFLMTTPGRSLLPPIPPSVPPSVPPSLLPSLRPLF